jgi:hypothetical protein
MVSFAKSIGWSFPLSAYSRIVPGCAIVARSGGLPP